MMRPAAALLLLLTSFATSASQVSVAITDAGGQVVKDAVVYIAGPAPVRVAKPTAVDVDQVDKEFVPRLSVVQTGTSVYFPNSDNIRHQVYSFSPAKVFTLKLYSGRPSDPVMLDQPGIVALGCNIHDRMAAWILVVDTPWFGLTDAAGHVVLDDLPAGSYELMTWRPGMRQPTSAGKLALDGTDKVERRVSLSEPSANDS